MNRIVLLSLVAIGIASPASAKSPFDGVWKLDPENAEVSTRVYDISLQDGVYACRTCRPPWSVPADGAFHPVRGQDFDETSVRVVDEHTVVFTRRKNGRGVYQAVDSISGDGKYLAFSWTEFTGAGKAITGTGSWIRVSPAPQGSHAITGTWRELRPDTMSDNTLTFVIRIDGDLLTMTYGTGESYAATFGGPAVAIAGAPSGAAVAVRKISDTSFQEIEMSDGEVVSNLTSTLVDQSTMEIVRRDVSGGRQTRRRARRQ